MLKYAMEAVLAMLSRGNLYMEELAPRPGQPSRGAVAQRGCEASQSLIATI